MFHKILFAFTILTLGCQSTSLREPSAVARPPQYVLLAFDGSKSLSMWEETRRFARENQIKFTYFVSGVYFISDADKGFYAEPQKGLGKSAIGWGGTKQEIQSRHGQVVAAINEGHEIASHANGHFDGGGYSLLEWQMEVKQFRDILRNGWELYGRKLPSSYWTSYFDQKMVGFRAPLLGNNANTIQALATNGYKYDTSKVNQMAYWPQRINGIWNFPLAGLRISRTGKNTLSMDYNFYVADSAGKQGAADSFALYEERMFESYLNYFKNNYFGNRAPIDIGHHFSKWNGGAYWNAMKRFARAVCNQPEVKCVTYREYMNFLEKTGANQIAQYQAGQFTKMSRSDVTFPETITPISTKEQTAELSQKELDELIKKLPPVPHDEDSVNSGVDI